MPEHGWTPLFFLDEAVGLAAGHRPCAYCRPDAYRAYKTAWAHTGEANGHADIDRALHIARVTRARTQVRYKKYAPELPDGTMVQFESRPHLIHLRSLLPYSPSGYGSRKALPNSALTVLTPAPTVAVLRNGFKPFVHPSANIRS